MNENGNIELKQGLNNKATCDGHPVGRLLYRPYQVFCFFAGLNK